jgi:hypothetical protein
MKSDLPQTKFVPSAPSFVPLDREFCTLVWKNRCDGNETTMDHEKIAPNPRFDTVFPIDWATDTVEKIASHRSSLSSAEQIRGFKESMIFGENKKK